MGPTDVRSQNINQGDRKGHMETAVGDFAKDGGMQMSAEASERNHVGRQRMLLKYHKAEPKMDGCRGRTDNKPEGKALAFLLFLTSRVDGGPHSREWEE